MILSPLRPCQEALCNSLAGSAFRPFLCALAVLFCELLAKPFANMGVMDDGAYVPIARALAATGHIAYTGWATPMLGLQLYLGAAFIKLFGFSFSAVRMSTLLVAVAMAFVFQRTLVRVGITERTPPSEHSPSFFHRSTSCSRLRT